jgi:phosphatidate cytidylyltransferase
MLAALAGTGRGRRQPATVRAPLTMLAQRIATALVLLAVLVASLASSSVVPFALLMLVMVLAAAWEWGRLSGLEQGASLALAAAAALVILATIWVGGLPVDLRPGVAGERLDGGHARVIDTPPLGWWVAALAWMAGLALVLRAGVGGWLDASRLLRIVTGLAILVATWWAVVIVRAFGINFLLSTLVIVWASDIAAYFGGKAWGGKVFGPRKLAPSISPGKTWEGAVSGMVGALVVSLSWVLVVDARVPAGHPSLQGLLVQRHGWMLMLAAVVVVTIAGILGDLFESLVKRAAGAKDSSRLLPGHGGVLDRVDALLPVLPIAVALAYL